MTAICGTATELRPALEASLERTLGAFVARADGHHGEFRELCEASAQLVRGGKKLRPLMFLHVLSGLVGRPAVDEAVLDVACAIELLHAALVMHDDVIDRDSVRRGQRNVSGRAADRAASGGAPIVAAERFGAAAGIVAGDQLLSLAMRLIARADIAAGVRGELVGLIDEAVFASAAGEHADAWFRLGLDDASADRVRRTAALKTAAYSFQAPLAAAAVLARVDDDRARALREIGRRMGVVYQLRDDVLGVFGDPVRTGKSVVADLREGTQSLLVVFARDASEWPGVSARFGDDALEDDDAEAIRRVMRDSGARDRVEGEIAAERDRVGALIVDAVFAPALEAYLLDMLDRCTERTS